MRDMWARYVGRNLPLSPPRNSHLAMIDLHDVQPPGPTLLAADRLAVLYPDMASVRRVLALARVDARRVAIDGHAANTWWSATLEATRQGRLAALLAVAVEEYPLDPWLQAIYGQVAAAEK